MMANFYFTEQAEKDLEAIIDFTLQRWGAAQSHNYIDDLEALAQILANNFLDVGRGRHSIAGQTNLESWCEDILQTLRYHYIETGYMHIWEEESDKTD